MYVRSLQVDKPVNGNKHQSVTNCELYVMMFYNYVCPVCTMVVVVLSMMLHVDFVIGRI